MDDYFGIILFAWIVIAPTVGLAVLGRSERRTPYRGSSDAMRRTTGVQAE
jgi:hypothetical protein